MSTGGLAFAQDLIHEVVDGVALLVSLQGKGRTEHPWPLILHRGGRIFLRRDPATRPVLPQPVVVASGYANPTWEILQDAPAVTAAASAVAVAAAARASLSVIKTVDALIDLLKKVRLNHDDVFAARVELRRRAAESSDPLLRDLRSSVNVDTTRGAAEGHPDWAVLGPYQPSVPDSVEPGEAVLSLVAHRVVEAALALANAAGQGQNFGAELMEANQANERLAVTQQVQRDLLHYALGNIERGELERRVVERRDGDGSNSMEREQPNSTPELGRATREPGTQKGYRIPKPGPTRQIGPGSDRTE